MKFKNAVAQIKDDAVKAAKKHKVNKASKDYKVGYIKGVRMMALLVELSHAAAVSMAEEEKSDPVMSKIFLGYADGLKKILDTSDFIIPVGYDTGDV